MGLDLAWSLHVQIPHSRSRTPSSHELQVDPATRMLLLRHAPLPTRPLSSLSLIMTQLRPGSHPTPGGPRHAGRPGHALLRGGAVAVCMEL